MTKNRKQTFLYLMLIVTLGILAWQTYLLTQSHSALKLSQKQNKMGASIANTTPSTHLVKEAVVTRMSTSSSNPRSTQSGLQVRSSNPIDPSTRVAMESQALYLQLVKQYQVAQMKRMIAEDNEAIAVANRNAVRAMGETAKLTEGKSLNLASTLGETQPKEKNYRLIFTGKQDGEWNATLRWHGKLLDVRLGQILEDGFKVHSITRNGVTVVKDRSVKHITFYGVRAFTLPRVVTGEVQQDPKITPSKSVAISAPKSSPKLTQKPASVKGNTKKLVLKAPTLSPSQQGSPQLKDSQSLATPQTKSNRPSLLMATVMAFASRLATPAHTFYEANFAGKQNQTLQSKVKEGAKQAKVKTKLPLESQIATLSLSKPAKDNGVVKKKNAITITKKSVLRQKNKPHMLDRKNTIRSKHFVKPAPHYRYDAKRLLAMENGLYTIQLMGNRHLKPIKRFMTQNNISSLAKVYVTQYRGKPWYILVYGQFPTIDRALQSIAYLPIGLQRWSPFVKSFNTVKNEINLAAS